MIELLEKAKNAWVPDCFGSTNGDDYNDTLSEMDRQFYQYKTAWGCTQYVVMDKSNNLVVKFPFDGMWHDDCDDKEYWEKQDYIEDKDGRVFEEFPRDYSEISYILYKKAEDAGVVDMFAHTEKVEGGRNVFYAQEFVTPLDSVWDDDDFSENSKNIVWEKRKSKEFGWWTFDEAWLAKAVDVYGCEKVEKFMAFIKRECLDDWHDGNYGYRQDGTPAVLDWAGFYD